MASEREELISRFAQQVEGKAPRAYPEGRTGADDEGLLAARVGADLTHKRVRFDFGKSVRWVSLTPAGAIALAELLIAKAREVSDEPITVNRG